MKLDLELEANIKVMEQVYIVLLMLMVNSISIVKERVISVIDCINIYIFNIFK
jgi:hypothetical protein